MSLNNKMPAHLELSLRKDILLIELVESVKKGELKCVDIDTIYLWSLWTPKKKESIYAVCAVYKKGNTVRVV